MPVMPLYASVGSNDIDRAVAFYEGLLGTIGWSRSFPNPAGGCFFGHPDTGMFAVVRPFDGNDACVGNGAMVGFALSSNAAVDDFHAKALALGATDEGVPGYRGPEEFGAYFSYFRDLDGNKLTAYCWKLPPQA
ncbi:MAG: VOC family protein [Novosphingobium sp.]|nr:VOC family protein [Novosphingobium sp.]